jgi:bifunctional oligoribonuclease and PAP phosphatase NrnA
MKDENYDNLWGKIQESEKILIIGHRKPDGDALGSMCAMKLWLDSIGKDSTMACIDKPASRYSFIPLIDEITNAMDPAAYDLIVMVDCGAHYMSGFHVEYPEILENKEKLINIDHHASNDDFGGLNIVDEYESSATMIIYDIFRYFDIEITPEIATCLLTGIYNDTGSFMHSNTSEDVFRVSADLLAKGAQISQMIKALFKSMSVNSMRSWGKALMNAKVTDDNFVLSVVRENELLETQDSEQLGGVIDYLNMVPNVKFAMLLKEERGQIKGSFRTKRDDVDLSKIAALYGGGGHPKASGFAMNGRIAD